jgi:hypothetical protein
MSDDEMEVEEGPNTQPDEGGGLVDPAPAPAAAADAGTANGDGTTTNGHTNTAAFASEDDDKSPYQGAEYAVWPRCLPPLFADATLGIVVGNTRCHWGIHGNFQKDFYPSLFWK